jgi:hypothetical protein
MVLRPGEWRFASFAGIGSWALVALCVLACSGEVADDGQGAVTQSSGNTAGSASGSDGEGGTAGFGAGGTMSTTSDCANFDVGAVFRDSCGGSGCHEGTPAASNLTLTEGSPETALSGVASLGCASWDLLVPGSPERSLVYQKLVLDTPPCGLRMPVEAPLSASDVECVAQWIQSLGGPDAPPPCETCGTTLCIDTTTNSNHCGGCQSPCAPEEVCEASDCVGCDSGLEACGDTCVDTQTDERHCGNCDSPCGGSQQCVAGECQCVATEAVSFAGDVQPIFDASCATQGCHAGRRPQDGLSLESGSSYAALVGIDSAQCQSPRPLVTPEDVSASYLMNKILGTDMCAGTSMPKGFGSLTADEMNVIGAWICGGALED